MPAMTTGRILCFLVLIFSVILIFLSLIMPGVATHLVFWTLALLALLALGVVLG